MGIGQVTNGLTPTSEDARKPGGFCDGSQVQKGKCAAIAIAILAKSVER